MLTTPLSPALGVEVAGIDLRDDLAPVADELRAQLGEHGMLCFREPDLEPEHQLRLLGLFGPILDESRDGSGWTLVSTVEKGGVLGKGAYLFHSDLEFTDEPVCVLSLYALEVPETPTSTRFANGVRAATRLDPDLARELDGRRALHVYPLTEARGDERYRLANVDEGAARAEHAVLLTHPLTGAQVLYATQMQTDSILGLPEAESEALLERCWAAIYAPDNIYEHTWRVGDLLVWDNLALQHARDAVVGRRTLRRVPVGTVLARLRTNP